MWLVWLAFFSPNKICFVVGVVGIFFLPTNIFLCGWCGWHFFLQTKSFYVVGVVGIFFSPIKSSLAESLEKSENSADSSIFRPEIDFPLSQMWRVLFNVRKFALYVLKAYCMYNVLSWWQNCTSKCVKVKREVKPRRI